MNIDNFKHTDTALHKFIDFCKSTDLKIIEHDWDHMCGIEVRCKLGDAVLLNFWADGSFRCLIDPNSDECLPKKSEPEPEPKSKGPWYRFGIKS